MGGNKELQLLESLFEDLTAETNPKRVERITDLFVRVSTTTGEVALYDDDDNLLASQVLFSWITNAPISTDMIGLLRHAVTRLDRHGYWAQDCFVRPFSIELVGEDFSVIEHLLFVDDDLVQVSRPLLEGLDEDLNHFLSNLLSDLK